jgi:hypothetical protein
MECPSHTFKFKYKFTIEFEFKIWNSKKMINKRENRIKKKGKRWIDFVGRVESFWPTSPTCPCGLTSLSHRTLTGWRHPSVSLTPLSHALTASH